MGRNFTASSQVETRPPRYCLLRYNYIFDKSVRQYVIFYVKCEQRSLYMSYTKSKEKMMYIFNL